MEIGWIPSPEAEAEGVCHTRQECVELYKSLSSELKAPALQMLSTELEPTRQKIEEIRKCDPDAWITPVHFFWGMAVRNLLRRNGFGEEYFGVHNLDDIYTPLIEEALKLNQK